MRIAMLATSRQPLAEPFAGGQESHTALLAASLTARGHSVRLYAARGTDSALTDQVVCYPPLPDLSEVAAVDPQLPEPHFLTDHAAFTWAVADLLAHPDVDIVHNQSLHFLPLAWSALLPAPLVATLHTPPFPWMELGVALADSSRVGYVCVSQAAARPWTCLPGQPRIIHNGVRDDGGGAGSGGSDLVWTGRMVPEKGADLAIAVARRTGLRLSLVGPISNADWFADAVAPHLDDQIRYLGHLDHAQVATVVRSSAVSLVTPRWEEPFGLVAAESAVWGTPVLALDRGGLREVVTTGVGVLVPTAGRNTTEQLDDLARAVPRAAALDRAQVRSRALAAFSAEAMTEQYEALYRELIHQGVG